MAAKSLVVPIGNGETTTLTNRQEMFCMALFNQIIRGVTIVLSDAYRAAYSTENMKPETIWSKASHTYALDKVRARVDFLLAEWRKGNALDVTLETQTRRHLDLFVKARDSQKWTAANNALNSLNRIHGLDKSGMFPAPDSSVDTDTMMSLMMKYATDDELFAMNKIYTSIRERKLNSIEGEATEVSDDQT